MKKKILGAIVLLGLLTGCGGNIKDGVALLEQEKYEEAIAVFQEDVKKEKNLDEAYRGIGIAYYELEQYEEAADALESALNHEAKETATFFGMLGACYMQLETYDKALDAYQNALKQEDITDTLKQEIQYNLIAVYEYAGDWEEAKKQAEKYVKSYPDDTRMEDEAKFLETR